LATYREAVPLKINRNGRLLPLVVLLSGVTALAACSAVTAPKQPQAAVPSSGTPLAAWLRAPAVTGRWRFPGRRP